jgi:hypothetical protein
MQNNPIQTGIIYISNELENLFLLNSNINQSLIDKHLEPDGFAEQGIRYKKEQKKLQLHSTDSKLESVLLPLSSRYFVGHFTEEKDLVLQQIDGIMDLKQVFQDPVSEQIVEMKSIHLATDNTIHQDWVDYQLVHNSLDLEPFENELEVTGNYLDSITLNTAAPLDLNESFLATFRRAHVLQYQPEMGDLDTLLPVFQQIAYLIHGVWVIKSEFLYENETLLARNYLLSCFMDSNSVSRSEFCQKTGLNNAMSFEMHQELAVLHGNRWRLKLDSNSIFEVDYPDLVESQSFIVKELGKSYVDIFIIGLWNH